MYMGEFRDPNQTNLDEGILRANEKFATGEKRKFLGILSINVDDLLISGSSEFTEYTSRGDETEIRCGYLWVESDLFRREISTIEQFGFEG